MLVQTNQSFRSSSPNPLERKSVEDSFARSILWGFTVAAESGGSSTSLGAGRVLVDATGFLLRDVTGAAGALRPGSYRVDPGRSAFFLPNTRNFPKNTEVDVTLTFVNDTAGARGGGNAAGPSQGPQPDRRWPTPAPAEVGAQRALLRQRGQRHAIGRRGDPA